MHAVRHIAAIAVVLSSSAADAAETYQVVHVALDATGVELMNHPLAVDLTPSTFDYGGATSDGRDIHFIDHEANDLPHWIETWSPTGTSRIWTLVPQISPGSSIELFLLYGNPDFASGMDGDAIFDFFDDFEGDALDTDGKWAVLLQDEGTTLEVSDGVLMMGRGPDFMELEIESQSVLNGPKIIEFRQQIVPGGNDYYYSVVYYGLVETPLYSSIGYASLRREGVGDYESAVFTGPSRVPPTTASRDENDPSDGTVVTFPGSSGYFKEVFVVPPGPLTRTLNGTITEESPDFEGVSVGRLGLLGKSPDSSWSVFEPTTTRTDYVFVRPYVAVEPVATLQGILSVSQGLGPSRVELRAAPNPSTHHVIISIRDTATPEGRVGVYDVAGRLVRTLDHRNRRHTEIAWDRLDDHGRRVLPGVYFVKYWSPDRRGTTRLTVLD